MSTEIIQVPVTAPAFPLVLADSAFLATLATVEGQAATIKITDAQSAQAAADLQGRLTKAGAALDKARLALKRPFIDINAQIDETAKAPLARIEAAKTAIKGKLTAYDLEQQRIAREAEQARLRELARLEAIRVAEEKAAKEKAEVLAAQAREVARIAEEAAQKQGVPVMEMDDDDEPEEAPAPPPKTETELAIEAVKFAPAAVAAKPAGVAYKSRLIHRVVDINKLPDSFVIKSENAKAIRAVFCDGWKDGDAIPTCPGMTFEVDRTVVSTGRAQF